VKGAEVVPGELYAILPSRMDRDDAPIRPGTAVSVERGGMLAYLDDHDVARTAHLSRVAGPWRPHAESRDRAAAAAGQLATEAGIAGDGLAPVDGAGGRAYVVCVGYARHLVVAELAADAAARLAAQLGAGGG
jgi:hypothetical protein